MAVPKPLADLKVLDLTRLLPGPFATGLLADLGADVLKVEAPNGDYLRPLPPIRNKQSIYFGTVNRNKRSIEIDLKTEAGREVLHRLLAYYDVLVEAYRPGKLAKFGFDYESLKQKHPRLIYASITGYGHTGPYANRAGHDLNYLAISGGASLTGTHDGQLAIPAMQIADTSGGLYLACAILAKVVQRSTDGQGGFIDVGMADCVRALHMFSFAEHFHSGTEVGPAQMIFTGKYVCYDLYRTKDGRYMSLCALEPKFWQLFCQTVGKQHLIGELFALAKPGGDVKTELDELFASRTLQEWRTVFADVDCCCEPVLNLTEAAAHPQTKARDMVRDVDHPTEGSFRELPLPVRFVPEPQTPDTPSPQPGEHTVQALTEAGFTEEEIVVYRQRGAFGLV